MPRRSAAAAAATAALAMVAVMLPCAVALVGEREVLGRGQRPALGARSRDLRGRRQEGGQQKGIAIPQGKPSQHAF